VAAASSTMLLEPVRARAGIESASGAVASAAVAVRNCGGPWLVLPFYGVGKEGPGLVRRAPGAVPYIGGRMTLSITWMTPFDVSMSAVVTVASLIFTVPMSIDGDVGAVDGGGHHAVGQVARHDRAGDDVVGQDGGQRLGVLQKALDRAFGQRGERLVRGSEDGERTFARQRLDEARGLDSGDQRGEAAGFDGGFDDVHVHGACGCGRAWWPRGSS
jgi:hypothetical protein